MHPSRALSVLSLALWLSACQTTPDVNANLSGAQQHLRQAQQDPQVVRLANEELQRARHALSLAEQAHLNGESNDVVDHLAYLADQRVSLAQAGASSRAAQAAVSGASAERNEMLLGRRTQEADAAHAALNESRREAQRDHRQDTTRIESLEQQLRELGARQTEQGTVVTLGDIMFDHARDQVRATALEDLRPLARFFQRHPAQTARIEGHTDSVGSTTANAALSQRRADAVRQALMNLGASASQLQSQGMGETHPVATNATAAGRQMNRRVDVIMGPAPTQRVQRQP